MTDVVQIALIAGLAAGVPATITALGAFLASRKNGREIKQISEKVDGYQSKLTERSEKNQGDASYRLGKLDEQAEVRERDAKTQA